MGKVGHELWTFCKAELSAQVATMTDFLVTVLLAEGCGLWYVWASLAGSVAGGVLNCCINYRWVFDAHGTKRSIALRYLLVWGVSIALNTLGTYAATELSGQHFILGKALVAVIVAVGWNYTMQRRFVYK
ncbi:MAG: GtrA family protein [Prevotella sp.]|nr:GtrA family protein [Prevotella sp.]